MKVMTIQTAVDEARINHTSATGRLPNTIVIGSSALLAPYYQGLIPVYHDNFSNSYLFGMRILLSSSLKSNEFKVYYDVEDKIL